MIIIIVCAKPSFLVPLRNVKCFLSLMISIRGLYVRVADGIVFGVV